MFCITISSKLVIDLNYFGQYLKNDKFAPRLLLNLRSTAKLLIIDTT